MRIQFRPLEQKDFQQIYIWANTDFVIQWYGKKPLSIEDVEREYGATITGEDPTDSYIIMIDGVDVGYLQTYFYSDYPHDEYYEALEAGEDSAGVDLFIGHKDYIHKGHGMHIMKMFLKEYVFKNPRARDCIITPEPKNTVAIKTYEKSGFKWYKTISLPNGEEEYLMVLKREDFRAEGWDVKTCEVNSLKNYRFVVIFARYKGQWLYSRYRDRDTYETAGGHIEAGETTVESASRELYEETGALDFEICPAFDYYVNTGSEYSNGQVFAAEVHELGDIPPDSEMCEVMVFDTIPDKMTYPYILPVLYEKMKEFVDREVGNGELWDIYDGERNLTGRTHARGKELASGDYHIVVHVWIMNSKGEFLITKRAPNKNFPNIWECTGGSAVAGDTSLEAAVREVKEETGLSVLPENGKCIFTFKRRDSFCDVWLFRQDFDIAEVELQEGETCGAKWADKEEISIMILAGEFFRFSYIDRLFEGKPLANARSRITDASGAVAGSSNGEFITDEDGEIMIPNLKP